MNVLFLHGFLGSPADWAGIAGAFDGVAASIPTCDDWEATLDALERTLRDLPAPRALVGYSMGGRLALGLALRGLQLDALVLESAQPGLEGAAARRERREQDARRAHAIDTDFSAFLAEWYGSAFWASLRREPERFQAMLVRRRAEAARAAHHVTVLSPGAMPNHWPHLRELDVPTLLVAGALDAKYCAVASRAEVALPRARSVIVPDAGHNVHHERPTAFATAVRTFLHSLDG